MTIGHPRKAHIDADGKASTTKVDHLKVAEDSEASEASEAACHKAARNVYRCSQSHIITWLPLFKMVAAKRSLFEMCFSPSIFRWWVQNTSRIRIKNLGKNAFMYLDLSQVWQIWQRRNVLDKGWPSKGEVALLSNTLVAKQLCTCSHRHTCVCTSAFCSMPLCVLSLQYLPTTAARALLYVRWTKHAGGACHATLKERLKNIACNGDSILEFWDSIDVNASGEVSMLEWEAYIGTWFRDQSPSRTVLPQHGLNGWTSKGTPLCWTTDLIFPALVTRWDVFYPRCAEGMCEGLPRRKSSFFFNSQFAKCVFLFFIIFWGLKWFFYTCFFLNESDWSAIQNIFSHTKHTGLTLINLYRCLT